MADYFGIDPTIVRVIWALLAFFLRHEHPALCHHGPCRPEQPAGGGVIDVDSEVREPSEKKEKYKGPGDRLSGTPQIPAAEAAYRKKQEGRTTMMTYPMHVAGLVRDLPICKVTEDFYIGAFIMFGDAELTVACARDLLKLAEELDYDYLLTAEAKSIPLIHEMARQSGAEKYFIARKGPKVYMPDPISVGGSLHHHARRAAALPRPRRRRPHQG